MTTPDTTPHIALVTGASRGIGASIALTLAQHGFHVTGTATTPEGAARISEHLSAFAGCQGACLQVNDAEQVQALVDGIVKASGGLHVLVNNAGITRDSMFHKMDIAQWRAVLDTNLNSLFNMCRPVIEGMRERKFGRIISISSINGQKGQMGQTNYSAAKAGEIGFTKALAQENARVNVTVNAICPGYIGTEMVQAMPQEVLEKRIIPQIPAGRLGTPEEIARCVVFLAADDAGFITGSTLTANGGQYMV